MSRSPSSEIAHLRWPIQRGSERDAHRNVGKCAEKSTMHGAEDIVVRLAGVHLQGSPALADLDWRYSEQTRDGSQLHLAAFPAGEHREDGFLLRALHRFLEYIF